jgi:hypothetical protein
MATYYAAFIDFFIIQLKMANLFNPKWTWNCVGMEECATSIFRVVVGGSR